MDLRIFFLFTLAISICIADDSAEDNQDGLQCASNYLKAKNLLDSNFRVKIMPTHVSDDECLTFVDAFKEAFYETMDKEVRNDTDLAEVADCLSEKAKEADLADLAIKSYVYDGAVSMAKSKRKKATKAIERAIEKKTETIVKMCASTKTFGELYDGLCKTLNDTSSSSESEEDSPLEDYCIRKYLTENNFINTTIHHVDLNPNKTDVAGADCNKIVRKARAEALDTLKKEFDEEDISPYSKKCVKKSLNNSKYFEVAGKTIVLCEITMTPEVKEFEREQFIEGMAKIYETIYRC